MSEQLDQQIQSFLNTLAKRPDVQVGAVSAAPPPARANSGKSFLDCFATPKDAEPSDSECDDPHPHVTQIADSRGASSSGAAPTGTIVPMLYLVLRTVLYQVLCTGSGLNLTSNMPNLQTGSMAS